MKKNQKRNLDDKDDNEGSRSKKARGSSSSSAASASAAAASAAAAATSNTDGNPNGNGNAPLTEAELNERRKKHNEVEIRRRQRIKNSFAELAAACGCDSKQKRVILSRAIEQIQQFQQRIAQLRNNIRRLDSPAVNAAEQSSASAAAAAASMNPNGARANPAAPSVSEVAQGMSPQEIIDHATVFQSSGVPLHIASFDGRILDCNDSFAALLGKTRADIASSGKTTLFSITAPESLHAAFNTVGALMNNAPSVHTRLRIVAKDNITQTVQFTAWAIREGDHPKYFMAMLVPSVDEDAIPAPAPAAVAQPVPPNGASNGAPKPGVAQTAAQAAIKAAQSSSNGNS